MPIAAAAPLVRSQVGGSKRPIAPINTDDGGPDVSSNPQRQKQNQDSHQAVMVPRSLVPPLGKIAPAPPSMNAVHSPIPLPGRFLPSSLSFISKWSDRTSAHDSDCRIVAMCCSSYYVEVITCNHKTRTPPSSPSVCASLSPKSLCNAYR